MSLNSFDNSEPAGRKLRNINIIIPVLTKMKAILRCVLTLFLGLCCSCTTINEKHFIPNCEGSLQSFCQLKLERDLTFQEPHNPKFIVTICHTGGSNAPPFSLRMRSRWPHGGNLVVWRDGVRLWDIEPVQMHYIMHATFATWELPIHSGCIYSFTFTAKDRMAYINPDPVTYEFKESSFNNPFLQPGKYNIMFEIMLPSSEPGEKPLSQRIKSNTIEIIIAQERNQI